jgi:hypothetical protein
MAVICIHFVSRESVVPDEVRVLTCFSDMEGFCVCIKHDVITHRFNLLLCIVDCLWANFHILLLRPVFTF